MQLTTFLTATNGGILLNAGNGNLEVGLSGGQIANLVANNGSDTLTGGTVVIGGVGGGDAQVLANSGNIAVTASGPNASSIAGNLITNNVGSITITNAGTATMNINSNLTTDQGSITLTVASTSIGGAFTTSGANFKTNTGNIAINLNGAGSSLTTSGGSFISDYAPGSSPAKLSGGFTINLAGNNTVFSANNTSFTANYGNLAVNITGNTSNNATALTLDNSASFTANTGNVAITYSGTTNAPTSMIFGNAGSASITANGGNLNISATGAGNSISAATGSSFQTWGGNINISAPGSINLAIGTTSGGGIAANDGSVTIASGSTSTTSVIWASTYAGNGDLNITNAGTGVTNVSGNLTTLNGSLNIIDSNAAGAIDFGTSATTTANITNGNVTIQNTNNTNGIITFEANSTIHASATAPNLGNVTVADGTFSSAMLASETTPPGGNVTYNFQPGGAIYFAKTGSVGQPGFPVAGNVLNAYGRAVTLFVGGGASSTGQINFNGGVTLTADPPPVTTLASTVQSASVVAPSNSAVNIVSGISAAGSSRIGGSTQPELLSPASSVLNAASAALNYQSSGLGAIQSSTLASASKVLYGGVTGNGPRSYVCEHTDLAVKQLPGGAHLLSADQDTAFETSTGTVFVAKGALALIVSDNSSLSVYNLDDTSRGAVMIMVGREKITLSPGRHATITNNASAFELVNPIRTLGYRSVTSRKLGDNLTVHSSEFSLPSALATIAPVRMLVSSADQNQKKVGQHLLKTAAILQTLSAQRAPYTLKTPPEATAMR